jgi:spore coat polysaccharide biosynthesis protein SpsF
VKIIGVTQARIASSRLPRKILLSIKGKSLLQYHLERAKQSKMVDEWIVATSDEADSELICKIADQLSISSYKGSMNNVLDRFYQAVKNESPDYVVRITSDCPLIDPVLIDAVVEACVKGNYDYASNTLEPSFPDGVDVEIFSFNALKKAHTEASLQSELEHVTPYIWKNCSHFNGKLFNSFSYKSEKNYSSYRLTVDEPNDFELIRILIENMGEDQPWQKYIEYLDQYPEVKKINSSIKRNQGYQTSIQNDHNIKL